MTICDACNKTLLVPLILKCDHCFCFVCIAPDKIDDIMKGECVTCHGSFNGNCELIGDNKNTDKCLNYMWLYSSNYTNTWWSYNRTHSEKVELIYQDYCLNKKIMNGDTDDDNTNISVKITKKQSVPKMKQQKSLNNLDFNKLDNSDTDDNLSVDFSSLETENSSDIEEQEQPKIISYIVNIYGTDYKLDFDSMKQINLHDTYKKRSIKRIEIPASVMKLSGKDIISYLSSENVIGISGKKFDL